MLISNSEPSNHPEKLSNLELTPESNCLGKPHYLSVGGGKREGEQFWTTPGRGAKNFRLDQFVQCSFFMLRVFRALFIFWSWGRKFLDVSERGANNFNALLRGAHGAKQGLQTKKNSN